MPGRTITPSGKSKVFKFKQREDPDADNNPGPGGDDEPYAWTTPHSENRTFWVSQMFGANIDDQVQGLSPELPLRNLWYLIGTIGLEPGDLVYLRLGEQYNADGLGTANLSSVTIAAGPPDDLDSVGTTGHLEDGRPRIITSPGKAFWDLTNLELQGDVTFLNVGFEAATPGAPGTFGIFGQNVSGAGSIALEGCAFWGYSSGVHIEGAQLGVTPSFHSRRNVYLDCADESGGDSWGCYLDFLTGIEIIEDLFDHNGWHEEGFIELYGDLRATTPIARSAHSGNLHLGAGNSGTVKVDLSYSTQAGWAGIEILCPFTQVKRNVLALSPIGAILGHTENELERKLTGISGEFRNNAIIDGVDLDEVPAALDRHAGYGLWLGNVNTDDGLTVTQNVVNRTMTECGSAVAVFGALGVGATSVVFTSNVIHEWTRQLHFKDGTVEAALEGWTIDANEFQQPADWSPSKGFFLVGHQVAPVDDLSDALSYGENAYWSPNSQGLLWAVLNTPINTYAEWVATSGESGDGTGGIYGFVQRTYQDPNVSLASFLAALTGLPADDLDFIEIARSREQFGAGWRDDLDAIHVLNALRVGFNLHTLAGKDN